MKIARTIAIFAILIAFPLASSVAAPKQYTFKKGALVKVSPSKRLCGAIKGKWKPVKNAVNRRGKKIAGKYVIDSNLKTRCAGLVKPGLVKNRGIALLPSLATLVKQRPSGAQLAAVSGTPPTLNEIPALVKALFWPNGEVDAIGTGTPTGEQCDDFFYGNADGDSSGLVGCTSVESVGRAFQAVLDGSSGVCYMSRIASKAALDSGGVEVIDGSLSAGQITKLFSTPSGSSSKTVKVVISGFPGGAGGQSGFLVIDSEAKLNRDGNQYGYTSYFCQQGQSSPRNYQRMTLSLDGKFKLSGYNSEGDHEFKNLVEASIRQSGSNIVFDLNKPRVAKSEAKEDSDNRFKVYVSVNPDNTIDSKVKERRGDSRSEVVSTSRFTGSDITTLRVLELASRYKFDDNRRTAALEYRDSAYVSAPGSALLNDLSDSALDDSFFESEGDVEPNFQGKSCSAEADITLRLDFSVPELAAIAAECETKRLESQSFCFANSDIGTALTQFPIKCGG
ncbi:MAG: hypothetical protein RL417_2060 [Pseudomonadota bacterium]